MDKRLTETIAKIRQPDRKAASACRAHWNRIGKPLYGLGMLEEYLVKIAGIQRTEKIDIRKKALAVFCADNGVVREGVSQTGQEVTAIVAGNLTRGMSCAVIMCRRAGADVFPVDVGIASDVPGIRTRKCRYGTGNMAEGPAMTVEEALFGIEAGISEAFRLKAAGYSLIAGGEMGIGNTTTSTAVLCALLGLAPETVTGRGAGLSDEGLCRKIEVIKRSLAVNRPDPEDPLDVLAKVGGFDIAALAGLCLGGAACGMPVVLDGFISAAAAVAACRIAPPVKEYLLASHMSDEPGTAAAMAELGFDPVIHAGMHLGEGTGAAALFPLLDMASDVYYEMDTFEGIAVKAYEDYTGK